MTIGTDLKSIAKELAVIAVRWNTEQNEARLSANEEPAEAQRPKLVERRVGDTCWLEDFSTGSLLYAHGAERRVLDPPGAFKQKGVVWYAGEDGIVYTGSPACVVGGDYLGEDRRLVTVQPTVQHTFCYGKHWWFVTRVTNHYEYLDQDAEWQSLTHQSSQEWLTETEAETALWAWYKKTGQVT